MSLTPIGRAVRQERVQRLQAELRERELDGALFTERANFEYLTGVQLPPLWSSFSRLLGVVVPADGEPELLLPGFVADEGASETGWAVNTYNSLEAAGADLLAGLVTSAGLGTGRIGIERGRETRPGASLGDFLGLPERLSRATLVDASDAMWAVRWIKQPAEIERLRLASAAAGAGFAAAFSQPRVGATERQVGAIMEAGGLTVAADGDGWVQLGWIGITSGEGGYSRFVSGPRDRRLEHGDMVWADLGFTADGYWSDFCRTAVIGGATARQIDRQRRIVEATEVGTELARPGTAVADIARAVRQASTRLGLNGLGFGRLGHGIGLTATEPPSVVEHDPTILEANMVITVEPAAVEDDGLYCAEQIIVVGAEPEILSVYPSVLEAI